VLLRALTAPYTLDIRALTETAKWQEQQGDRNSKVAGTASCGHTCKHTQSPALAAWCMSISAMGP